MGEPGDSSGSVPPWVAMVSPNYSSSARIAWVHGEAGGAAAQWGARGSQGFAASHREHLQLCVLGSEMGWCC